MSDRRHWPPQRTGPLSRTIGVVVLLAVVSVLVMAREHGRQVSPSGERSVGSTTQLMKPRLTVPGDVLDAFPITQPTPVPGVGWRGWAARPQGRCAWLPDGLLRPLNPIKTPDPTRSTCDVELASGVRISIKWDWPPTRIIWSPFSTRTSTTIAGLPARLDKLNLLRSLIPGACQVTVNTHALTGLAVLAWRPSDRSPTPASRCDDATLTAELVARRLLVATGGSRWSQTPRAPTIPGTNRPTACELLAPGAIEFDLDDVTGYAAERTYQRDSCRYRHDSTEIATELATGTDANVSTTPHNDTGPDATYRQFGGIHAAREDRSADGCALSIQIAPERLLRTTYRSTNTKGRCVAAEMLAAQAMTILLDHTSADRHHQYVSRACQTKCGAPRGAGNRRRRRR